jgi:hypothetical protein
MHSNRISDKKSYIDQIILDKIGNKESLNFAPFLPLTEPLIYLPVIIPFLAFSLVYRWDKMNPS